MFWLAKMTSMETMRESVSSDAKNGFGRLLDAAQNAPVRVIRKGSPVGVVMPMPHHEGLRGVAWERLVATWRQ